MPKEDARWEMERELGGKEEEPSELIYFRALHWTYPLFPVMFVAECGFGMWLAIKGMKEPPSDLGRQ